MVQQHMFVCITTITTDTYIYEYILLQLTLFCTQNITISNNKFIAFLYPQYLYEILEQLKEFKLMWRQQTLCELTKWLR